MEANNKSETTSGAESASCCATCKKSPPQVSLKQCAKCLSTTVKYCSRDCQKADWKTHKKTCGKSGQGVRLPTAGPSTAASGIAGGASPPKGLDSPIQKPFTRLGDGTYLHDRPEKDVYRILIDAYRLRVEDEYAIEMENAEDSVYSGETNPAVLLRGFRRRFLDPAESRTGLLPAWWNAEKRAECEAMALDRSKNNWYDLSCAVEKSDIIDHYGDRLFPMQLRMLAEKVIGRGIGGQNGEAMRAMMALQESGEGPAHATVLGI